MLKKRNPISILEDSFLSIKEYIEGEMSQEKTFFDAAFIQGMKSETTSLIALCDILNQDQAFIQKINEQVHSGQPNSFLFKAEHFFLSDIIAIGERKKLPENEKALFTLAYYYDALRNKH